MTAGEVRPPAIGSISETANRSMHRAWAVLGEGEGEVSNLKVRHDAAAADVAALLAKEEGLPEPARQAVENLLRRHRLLETELARQRELLQEWMLSQLTYKTLYYQYSGQSPDAPRMELMREKDAVRRRIEAQFDMGGSCLPVPQAQVRSLSGS